MVPKAPRDPHQRAVRLLVGPGARALELGAVLAAIGAPRGVETFAFGDVADLALEDDVVGLVVLDVDATPVEDVGYVRRFLTAHPELELVLLGSDPRARTARVLGSRRFAHWPPDVEELIALVEGAAQGARPHSVPDRTTPMPNPPSPSRSASSRARAAEDRTPAGAAVRDVPGSATRTATADVSELDQVRAILEAGPELEGDRRPAVVIGAFASALQDTESFDSDLLESTDAHASEFGIDETSTERSAALERDFAHDFAHDFELDFEPSAASVARRVEAPVAEAPTPAPTLPPTTTAPPVTTGRRSAVAAPPWWRSQVADLADAAQRIDLSVKMLAQAAPEIDEGDLDDARARLRELEAEVARLLQFTRTLGYVAAPPPAGTQTFDLGEIVHLFATGLAQSGPEAPRCQFKTSPGTTVRSDRQLLSQALDAVFFLVRCTARKGDLVRARVQEVREGDGWVALDLDFPSGPLEGLAEADVVSPYSLSDLFPELGPNALAAAAGIVAGQGGELGLVGRGKGRMTWTLRLPRWSHASA